jgi:DNA-binding transcriptional LysR family regulator
MNDRLHQLALFVRTVETGSFSKAGRELGLTQPSVSRAIAALERRLGVKLLTRTTRQISTTDAGQALLGRAREAMAAIDDAEDAARGADRLSGLLRVALPTTYGARQIVPLIPAFLARHPELKIDLMMSDRYENLIAEGADLALRLGELPDSSFVTRKLASARRLFVAAPSYLASRNVLVNNAGINISRHKIGEVDDHAMMRTFLVNWVGPFRLCKLALPHMRSRGFGRIININSIYGLVSSIGNGPYTSTKFALTALTRTIAREYGRDGITCNQICPGAVESELMLRIANFVHERDEVDQEAYLNAVRESIPSGRMAQPEEIGELAVFLASDRAAHINGASLPVDGGSIA